MTEVGFACIGWSHYDDKFWEWAAKHPCTTITGGCCCQYDCQHLWQDLMLCGCEFDANYDEGSIGIYYHGTIEELLQDMDELHSEDTDDEN